MKISDLDGGSGASASLNKTISEIMEFMGDGGKRPNKGLRDFMYQKVGDLAVSWYKKGFNRGHKESLEAFSLTGEIPAKLKYNAKRHFAPGPKRSISMKSTVPKAKTSKSKRK